MKPYSVKYKSFNRRDYVEVVTAKNKEHAFKEAQRMIYKHDDRDKIISVEEDDS